MVLGIEHKLREVNFHELVEVIEVEELGELLLAWTFGVIAEEGFKRRGHRPVVGSDGVLREGVQKQQEQQQHEHDEGW